MLQKYTIVELYLLIIFNIDFFIHFLLFSHILNTKLHLFQLMTQILHNLIKNSHLIYFSHVHHQLLHLLYNPLIGDSIELFIKLLSNTVLIQN